MHIVILRVLTYEYPVVNPRIRKIKKLHRNVRPDPEMIEKGKEISSVKIAGDPLIK